MGIRAYEGLNVGMWLLHGTPHAGTSEGCHKGGLLGCYARPIHPRLLAHAHLPTFQMTPSALQHSSRPTRKQNGINNIYILNDVRILAFELRQSSINLEVSVSFLSDKSWNNFNQMLPLRCCDFTAWNSTRGRSYHHTTVL